MNDVIVVGRREVAKKHARTLPINTAFPFWTSTSISIPSTYTHHHTAPGSSLKGINSTEGIASGGRTGRGRWEGKGSWKGRMGGTTKDHGTRDTFASIDGWRPGLGRSFASCNTIPGIIVKTNNTSQGIQTHQHILAQHVGARVLNGNTSIYLNAHRICLKFAVFFPQETYTRRVNRILLNYRVQMSLNVAHQVSQGSYQYGALTPPSNGPTTLGTSAAYGCISNEISVYTAAPRKVFDAVSVLQDQCSMMKGTMRRRRDQVRSNSMAVPAMPENVVLNRAEFKIGLQTSSRTMYKSRLSRYIAPFGPKNSARRFEARKACERV
ncbi:hypothetical protein IW262DRAFT_1303055 [Armillaria fumosa]|nr:hypothetical protein IW262DRAFT_1303055 [Armillaria fumosa]